MSYQCLSPLYTLHVHTFTPYKRIQSHTTHLTRTL
ncbi:hypothetical protein [Staphylococcus phage PT94]